MNLEDRKKALREAKASNKRHATKHMFLSCPATFVAPCELLVKELFIASKEAGAILVEVETELTKDSTTYTYTKPRARKPIAALLAEGAIITISHVEAQPCAVTVAYEIP